MPGRRKKNPQGKLNSPSVAVIMRELDAAGPRGLPVGAITRLFSWPESIVRRNSRCNSILKNLADGGYVRRSEGKEPSVYYHNTPQYRWYITEAGVSKRQGIGRETDRQRRLREKREARQAALEKLGEAACSHGPQTPRPVRDQVIRELIAAGCGYSEVARVFGVSRELPRLIVGSGNRYKGHYRNEWPPSPLWRARWYRELIAAVREFMDAGHVSTPALAASAGLPLATVYSIVRGVNTGSPERLEMLAAACGLEITVGPRENQEEGENDEGNQALHDQH